MSTGIFVAGTDTDIGKTTCAVLLIQSLVNLGYKVSVIKPVASGCEMINGSLVSEDAVALQQAASVTMPLSKISPYCYAPPVSPHLAAEQAGQQPQMQVISDLYKEHVSQAELVVVEGAGGWKSPLAGQFDSADLVECLKLRVVLVVGLKLGCINHALLSVESMLNSKVDVVGWIANTIEHQAELTDQVIATLKQRIPAPLLGVVPRLDSGYEPEDQVIDVSHLIDS